MAIRFLPLIATAALATSVFCQGPTQIPANLRHMIEKTQSFGLASYPIGFWSYTNLAEHGQHMDEAAVEEWADAGFTVPQSPDFDPTDPAQKAHILRLLDWSQKRGMKLILCDPRGYSKSENGKVPSSYADGIRAAVRDFGSHPALFGFHVGDEPDKSAKDAFAESYRIQKQIAPNLHPFANLLPYWPGAEAHVGAPSWPAYLDQYSKSSNADLLSYDCYMQMNPGTAGQQGYYQNLRLYRDAALRNGIPFWNTILSVGHFRYRVPASTISAGSSTRQLRTARMASCGSSITCVSRRRITATLRSTSSGIARRLTMTCAWCRRASTATTERSSPIYLASTRVAFYPEAFGGGEVFTPDALVSRVLPDREGHPLLIGEFTDWRDAAT